MCLFEMLLGSDSDRCSAHSENTGSCSYTSSIYNRDRANQFVCVLMLTTC